MLFSSTQSLVFFARIRGRRHTFKKLRPVMLGLGLGLKAKIVGLVLGLEAQGLGLSINAFGLGLELET